MSTSTSIPGTNLLLLVPFVRPHLGDGRYILQDQKIHLSVLKRALIDQAVNRGAVPPPPIRDYAPYPTINAHLAPSPGIPQTWDTLLHISNRPLPLWEVS